MRQAVWNLRHYAVIGATAAVLILAAEATQAPLTIVGERAAAPPAAETPTTPASDRKPAKPTPTAAARGDGRSPNWVAFIIIVAAQAAGHGPGAAFPK
ncbi:MAG TPA: hypothetical protein VLX85_12815 [Stellaceae bacterium]|nr:hypothetical protein [Stellaceae bacterium]